MGKYSAKTKPCGTTIKRVEDGRTVVLSGKDEMRFLRERAYIASDNTKTGEQWEAEIDTLMAKFFGEAR